MNDLPPALNLEHLRRAAQAQLLELPARQRAVADQLLNGRPYKRIARDMNTAISTVAATAMRIYAKFGVRRRDEFIDAVRPTLQESTLAQLCVGYLSVSRPMLQQWLIYVQDAESAGLRGSSKMVLELAQLLQQQP